MKKLTSLVFVLLILMLFVGCGRQAAAPGTPGSSDTAADTSAAEPVQTGFVPKLDTEAEVTLDFASFFGNFEAMTEVLNDFNEYYPNVTLNMQTVSRSDAEDFLAANPYLDIFMTSNDRGYSTEGCVELLGAGVDVSAANADIIEGSKRDGGLYTLPMSLTLNGIVVNKTLLEKEGLAVPQTLSEFTHALDVLKQKGYTPIQGPDSAVSTLFFNMGMCMMADDPALLAAVSAGDAAGAAALKAAYSTMKDFIDKGYIDPAVDATYPADNYDGAILRFFEGDVPFWVCNTEKFSGMKKRESKSDAFKENPIEYAFMFAPLGENGAYEYLEPWYGFSVNENSDVCDYAVELLRFLAQRDELNTLASVKGVPSLATVSDDARYAGLYDVKATAHMASDGTIPHAYGTYFIQAASGLLDGSCADADAAVALMVARCAAAED